MKDVNLFIFVKAERFSRKLQEFIFLFASYDHLFEITLTGTGTGPLTWSIPPGQLPSGFSLNTSTGEIRGTTTADGGYVLTVTLAGLLGNTTRQFSLSVLAAGATEPIASPWARWTRG